MGVLARAKPARDGGRVLWVALLLAVSAEQVDAGESEPLFNDVHFHLSNYVQRGITARQDAG